MTTKSSIFNYSNTTERILELFMHSCHGRPYKELFPFEQQEARGRFFYALKKQGIEIDEHFILRFQKENPNSFITSMLSTYRSNKDAYMYNRAYKHLVDMLDEKITIVYFNAFGMLGTINTRIKDVKVLSYAQFSDSLQIKHIPKRRRTIYTNLFSPSLTGTVFYRGWVNIDINEITMNATFNSSERSVRESKYMSFDKRYLTDVIKKHGEPMFRL
ncbi:hypothetical protein [Terribacillus saccharophilus]|uniref:hypothetical protein n=1 Tax=Terribacillus saccharophilus TaxID=361277 RepID=UPI002989F1E3|nr:hypothetical protein [Terribacillus saccharophilus]MCM3227548.1 hypothetical protein [Terribacillus saccharophilus]